MRRSLPILLLGFAPTVSSASIASHPALEQGPDQGSVMVLLLRGSGEGALSRSDIASRLTDMWPDALPEVLDLLVPRAGVSEVESQESEHLTLGDLMGGPDGLAWDARGLLEEVLREWPRRRVLTELDGRIDESTPLSSRLSMIDLLEALGGEGLIDPLLRITEGMQPLDFASRRCSSRLEAALAAALAGDSQAHATLGPRLRAMERGLLESLARALASGSRQADVQLLLDMLDREEALDRVVLAELASLRWRSVIPAEQLGVGDVVSLLDHDDPRMRKLAALALGRLHHSQSFERLVELLNDGEVAVVRSANRALRDLSGLSWETDRNSWLRWQADELQWLHERAPRLEHELRLGAATSALRGARELGAHPLYRDEVAGMLLPGLARPEPGVVRSTCSALQRLGALSAAPELVGLLDDDDPGLAAGARTVLETLTGEHLGTDAAPWLAWVEGRPE